MDRMAGRRIAHQEHEVQAEGQQDHQRVMGLPVANPHQPDGKRRHRHHQPERHRQRIADDCRDKPKQGHQHDRGLLAATHRHDILQSQHRNHQGQGQRPARQQRRGGKEMKAQGGEIPQKEGTPEKQAGHLRQRRLPPPGNHPQPAAGTEADDTWHPGRQGEGIGDQEAQPDHQRDHADAGQPVFADFHLKPLPGLGRRDHRGHRRRTPRLQDIARLRLGQRLEAQIIFQAGEQRLQQMRGRLGFGT